MNMMSPLRYPGGKGQLYKRIKELITQNGLSQKTYVEPFAGGFSVGLSLLRDNVVPNVIINDYDYHIYCFWYCVFHKASALIYLIEKTPITIGEWKSQQLIYQTAKKKDRLAIAFATLFLNRTNFSGILRARPIGGMKQNGPQRLDCRFNKQSIINQIEELNKFRNRVKIYNLDAVRLIEEVLAPQQRNLFINFDPPYVKKGQKLYTNFYTEKDHQSLGECISKSLKTDWMMTYDDDPLIHKIYNKFQIYPFTLNYTAKNARKGRELLITAKNYKHLFFI